MSQLVTLVIELDDDDTGLADAIAQPHVVDWSWGNSVQEAMTLRGTVIDLLHAAKELSDVSST